MLLNSYKKYEQRKLQLTKKIIIKREPEVMLKCLLNISEFYTYQNIRLCKFIVKLVIN